MTYYINTVAIDYLSLTTYSHFDFINLAIALEREYEGGIEKDRRMQYEGSSYKSDAGGVFWGVGIIGDKEHHLIQASGMISNRVSEIAMECRFSSMSGEKEWSCKRLDIQLTMENPTLDAWDLRKRMRSGQWPKGIKRKLTVISSETDTLYIGSRASSVMFRIYQKDDENVRVELELKKDVSLKAWQYIIDNCESARDLHELIIRVLGHELKQIPNVAYMRPYRNKLLNGREIDISSGERKKSTFNKKLAWFISLEKSIVKLANDHENGWKVRDILQDILDQTEPNE